MKDCWINPNSEIIEVGAFNHDGYASELLQKEKGFIKFMEYLEENNCYPYEVLHKRGWIRVKFNDYLPKVEILGNCISLMKQMRNTIDTPMNSTQLRVAKKLCDEVGEDFHKAINDKRFW